jgi:hypothetical protein
VTTSDETDRAEVLADGSVVIFGSVTGAVKGSLPEWSGTEITSGNLRFAIWGQAPGPRVRCAGEITESHHHEPTAFTTGEIAGILWRPAIRRRTGLWSFEIAGYEPGIELRSTGDRPGREAVFLTADHEPSGTSDTWPTCHAMPKPEDLPESEDRFWAFEFTLRVDG